MTRTYWAAGLQPGEVALFHFLGKSNMLCNADGTLGQAAPFKFATLDDAETYAREYVSAHPDRGCSVYDASGNRVSEIRGHSVPSRRYTRKDAKRDLFIGVAGFLLIPIGFLVDAWIGWSLFLGMALGTKFVLLAIIKLSDGIAGLMESNKPR